MSNTKSTTTNQNPYIGRRVAVQGPAAWAARNAGAKCNAMGEAYGVIVAGSKRRGFVVQFEAPNGELLPFRRSVGTQDKRLVG